MVDMVKGRQAGRKSPATTGYHWQSPTPVLVLDLESDRSLGTWQVATFNTQQKC